MIEKSDYRDRVIAYYQKNESRLGYRFFLRGRKHFGYYPAGDAHIPMKTAQRLMEDRVGIALDLAPGSRVLDAGCGEGYAAMRMAERFSLRVEGVDLLDFNIERGRGRVRRRRLADRVHLQVADYTDLPFPDDSFDGLYTIEALVHAPDHRRALQEFLRVLKPGGKVVLLEYTMPSQRDLPECAREPFAVINAGSAMYSFAEFEHGKFPRILTDAGFQFDSVTDISYRVEPMLRRMARICWLPHQVAKAIGRGHRYVNALAAVEFYRLRHLMLYNLVIGHKPGRAPEKQRVCPVNGLRREVLSFKWR